MKTRNLFYLLILIPLLSVLLILLYLNASYEFVEPIPTPDFSYIEPEAPDKIIETPEIPDETPEPSSEPSLDDELAALSSIKPSIKISDWMYTPTNKDNVLSKDYAPELVSLEGEQSFDERAASYLQEMIDDARSAGLSVILTSSYRSYEAQQELFENKVQEKLGSGLSEAEAMEQARQIVAYPGTSEHQLGLAADIVDKHYDYMNESLADTELSIWLKENCADYGFILRYPEDKQDVTGIMFEPWHFRYVGKEAAAFIMENGLCLEEFVMLYN